MSEAKGMIEWIAAVIRQTGPRRPGTRGEAVAAGCVAEAFRSSCDAVRIEPVAARHGSFFGTLKLMLGGYAAAFALTWLWPGASLVLVLLLGATFLLGARGRFVLDPLFARTRSQNVVGVIHPEAERRRLLLFAGHHDSPLLMPLWVPARKSSLPRLYTVALVGFASQVLLSLTAALGGGATLTVPLGILSFAGLTTISLLAWGVLGWDVPCTGANDNLSSVAVVAALGRRLALRRPRHTEVWLLSFGCEEEGRFGSRDFAARYAPELEDAVLINLETVGSGELAIIRSERQGGRRYAPVAVERAIAAARHAGLEVPLVDLSFGATDALSFAEEGLPAVTVFGRDATGLFSLWHVEEDHPENLDAGCLERALGFCAAAVEITDRED